MLFDFIAIARVGAGIMGQGYYELYYSVTNTIFKANHTIADNLRSL